MSSKWPVTVKCCQCNTEFECFSVDQAYGCDANFNSDRTIRGHYGSAVADMTTFEFVSAHAWFAAGAPRSGIICDTCIQSFIDREIIKECPERSHQF